MEAKEKAEGFFRRRMSELQKNPALKKLILAVEFTKEAKICQEYADQQTKQLQEEVESKELQIQKLDLEVQQFHDEHSEQKKQIETLTKENEALKNSLYTIASWSDEEAVKAGGRYARQIARSHFSIHENY